eukprot:7428714-Pyramimonas_sp.AAC.1
MRSQLEHSRALDKRLGARPWGQTASPLGAGHRGPLQESRNRQSQDGGQQSRPQPFSSWGRLATSLQSRLQNLQCGLDIYSWRSHWHGTECSAALCGARRTAAWSARWTGGL